MLILPIPLQGAGDAFVGALAGYLATSHASILIDGPEREGPHSSLGDLLKRSVAVASHSVTAKGTQASYLVDTLNKDLLIQP